MLERSVLLVHDGGIDLVQHLLTLGQRAKHGVRAVEKINAVAQRDKELRRIHVLAEARH